MGNEMGNNNVTGQQVSEENANGFRKTIDHSDHSPGLNNTDDKEKDGSEDVDMLESLKDHIISNGGDEQIASDQKNTSTKNEDLEEKNGDSLQGHTSAQVDDQDNKLYTERGYETQKDKETEMKTNATETIVPVGTTIEDMTSNKDISTSDEFKQLVHKTTERSEESTIANPCTLLEENIEGSPEHEEESCSHEVAAVGGNLVGEDTVQNPEEGHLGVSTVEDLSPSPIQGETTSSTESIVTDYLYAEIKEVVIEDEPRERDNSSYLPPEDDTKQETSKNDNAGTPEEKEEICEMSQTTTVEAVIESDEVLEEDKKIHRLENQEENIPKCIASGALDITEVVSRFQSSLEHPSATNDREFQKHEPSKSIVATGQISDSVSETVEHNAIERTYAEQEGVVAKTVAVKNLADNVEGGKKSDGIHDFVSLVEVNGKYFTGLDPPSSDRHPILNVEKVQAEAIVEELAVPMTATSSALQLEEDFVKKRDIKPDSSDSNEGTITSTYEANTLGTQESMNSPRRDQPQRILLEEPEVVKFENSETHRNCMELVEYSSMTGLIFPNGSNKETEDTSATATCFTFESNQEKVTVTVGFTAESKQNKVTMNADKASEERCLLQTPTPGRDAGEETPLLQSTENINSLSYYAEQHGKVVKDIPMTGMALMQDEAGKESEKSPLLSPREPLEEDFRAPNNAGNKKPLRTLMTEDRVGMWYPLKEQEQVSNNSSTVSSPRSKEKQKPRSSFFASCMCCTTSTN